MSQVGVGMQQAARGRERSQQQPVKPFQDPSSAVWINYMQKSEVSFFYLHRENASKGAFKVFWLFVPIFPGKGVKNLQHETSVQGQHYVT